jgi:hypothetical protein
MRPARDARLVTAASTFLASKMKLPAGGLGEICIVLDLELAIPHLQRFCGTGQPERKRRRASEKK